MTIDAHRSPPIEFHARLRAVGTPERAANEKRYLKSDLEHLGATGPGHAGAIDRGVRRADSRDLTHDELVGARRGRCGRGPIFESRFAAALLLERLSAALLGPADLGLAARS